MSQPLIPWEPANIPEEIQSELDRRKLIRGFEFVVGEKGQWDELEGDWKTYKGPMTAWARFCSNGAGFPDPTNDKFDNFLKPGFVLYSGKNFYTGYGFSKDGDDNINSVIGYTPDGIPHTIENNLNTSRYPIHVPPPEIESINVTIQKELFRRATIEWVCFSLKQLEYMTPYFLTPNITCILEWGWNHFDPTSLLDLNDMKLLKELRNNPYPLYNSHILKSRGNYDVIFGIVTKFEWSIDGNKIKVKTEITSPDRIYAGLTTDASIFIKSDSDSEVEPSSGDGNKSATTILDSLKSFVTQYLADIKSVATAPDPFNIQVKQRTPDGYEFEGKSPISEFASYLRETYPDKIGNNKSRWEEILYGIFYGRNFVEKENIIARTTLIPSPTTAIPLIRPGIPKNEELSAHDKIAFDNKSEDFDRTAPLKNVWITMDLLVEILNYHSYMLRGFNNHPMFKIDISDCVISGHKNLISTNGYKVLIPNAHVPKYFYGLWGLNAKDVDDFSYNQMSRNDGGFVKIDRKRSELDPELYADWKLYRICGGIDSKALRDDLDVVINRLRYDNIRGFAPGKYAFPSTSDITPEGASQSYPKYFSGYLKNIYFNVQELSDILKDQSVKTFVNVLNRVLQTISSECGNFWDLRIINSTGKAQAQDDTRSSSEIFAAMKIVDYRFPFSINRGKVFTFDYYDADSLIQSINFNPTLGDSIAIRTIFANRDGIDKRVSLTDTSEVFNFKFKDRLFLSEDQKRIIPRQKTSSAFKNMMQTLQSIKPPEGSFQMTTKDSNDNVFVKRLAIPPSGSEVLKLLLDDGDIDNNPKYIGIVVGIQAQITIQGIGGLRTFMMFLIKNLPEPYSHKNIVFRIIDLTESIQNGKWTTTITAGILPLRKRLKKQLGIKD
jgi:hypothetical protein